MSRRSKGPRLYLKPARRDGDEPVYIIRDGASSIGTGCGAGDRAGAERKLAEYLQAKHQPSRRNSSIETVAVSDVISIYLADKVPAQARPEKAAERAERLLEFFGRYTLADISGALCRKYVAWRGNEGGARRDLQDLAAAINHHRREGFHREIVSVVLPPAGDARDRFLTRSEVARLLWVCLTTREMQDGKPTAKRPLRHLARFILLGVYTGSRPGAILTLSWHQEIGRGFISLDQQMIYRKAIGARATNKRQPPVPAGPELGRMLELWAKADCYRGPVVSFDGQPIASVKTAFKKAVRLAGLGDDVCPYTLRHTTASWLVQKGASTRKVAELLGTSEAMIAKHYGHLAPDHLREEAALVGTKQKHQSVANLSQG